MTSWVTTETHASGRSWTIVGGLRSYRHMTVQVSKLCWLPGGLGVLGAHAGHKTA